ncbi:MAG: hypothetical protein KGQ52_13095 [Alphaproteobacteria bacterium]|nr:hypothetical protein [Alphaproteobacteria bacterium]
MSNTTALGSMMAADKAARVARALKVSAEWLILGEQPDLTATPPPPAPEDRSRDSAATAMVARLMPPAGPDGRKRWPVWFHDKPVLEAVLETHRRAEMDRVLADLQERFGSRAPSRSSLGRFWLRLDAMFAAGQEKI